MAEILDRGIVRQSSRPGGINCFVSDGRQTAFFKLLYGLVILGHALLMSQHLAFRKSLGTLRALKARR
jgi:hypothetical protein